MAPHNIVIFALLVFNMACINMPMEIRAEKTIVINDAQGNYISNIKSHLLSSIDLGTATTEEACIKVFSAWLDEQLKIGLIPKRSVSSLEYGKKSSDPFIAQCNNVNLAQEIPQAWHNVIQSGQINLRPVFFDIEDFRNNAAKEFPCIKNMIVPGKKAVSLIDMKTVVFENTLNTNVPAYNIYYTTEKLSESSILEANAEENLFKSGAIKFFGKTSSFKAGFRGETDINLITDSQDAKAARDAFNTLQSNLIAFPDLKSITLNTVLVGKEGHYLLPQGKVEINVQINMLANLGFNDARCLMKKDIK
jgi:hypothetical protein